MVESSLTTLIDIDDDLGEGCHKYCGTVVGNDDFVYGIPYYNAKRIIKFDPANPDTNGMGWGDPIIGVDKCIYWTPNFANRVLKFDPETQQLPSLVGDDLGEGGFKWLNGALGTDGVIYCIPSVVFQILAIDPFKELSMTPHNNFRQHPQELGRLFVKDEQECEETFYKSAVRKFGVKKCFNLLKNALPWMRNGLSLIATPFHSLWWQLRARIVRCQ
jgi:hypothetical protein